MSMLCVPIAGPCPFKDVAICFWKGDDDEDDDEEDDDEGGRVEKGAP